MKQPGFEDEVAVAYRTTSVTDFHASLVQVVTGWLEGRSFADIALMSGLSVDVLLRIHTKIVLYDLTTLAEQAVAVVQEFLSAQDESVSPAIASFPAYLRFGVSTPIARELMAAGVRHRRAAVALGAAEPMTMGLSGLVPPSSLARELLRDEDVWSPRLGKLVYRRTVEDVASGVRGAPGW